MSSNYLSPFTSPKKQKPTINFKYHVPSLNPDNIDLNTDIHLKKSPQQKNSKNQVCYGNEYNQSFLSERQVNIRKQEGLQLTSLKIIPSKTDFSTVNYCEIYDVSNCQSPKSKVHNKENEKKMLIIENYQQCLCEICHNKKSSYLVKQIQKYCCSNCAIEQMKAGDEIIKIQEFVQKSKKNQKLVSKVRSKEQSKSQIEKLVQKVQLEQQRLEKFGKQALDLSSVEGIKQCFQSQKNMIRMHYEKLRETITISIQKDLQCLKLKEEQALKNFSKIQKQIQKNKIKLWKVFNLLQKSKYVVQNEDSQKLDIFIKESSQKISSIINQIQLALKPMISRHKQMEKQTKQNFCETQIKKYLNQPALYMLLIQKQGNQTPLRDLLFSFRDEKQGSTTTKKTCFADF